MTREFTNLKAGEQRAVLYEKDLESNKTLDKIEKHLDGLNGKVNKHEKELNVIKAIGACIFIWICIATGAGLPYLPGL